MSKDDELIMVVTTPEDKIMLAGKPRKLNGKESREYMQPGWTIKTMKFSEYKQLNKKWVFE
jgi:hypothetical protein